MEESLVGGTDRAQILLVEDNVDDERLALRAGKRVGVEDVVVARTGDEAVRMLTEGNLSDQLGLILLDLKLPKVSGLEVLQKLRTTESTKGVPVVVFTSSDEEADVIRSYELGANSYVRKPVDYDNFMDAVQSVLTYWLGLNKLPTTPTS